MNHSFEEIFGFDPEDKEDFGSLSFDGEISDDVQFEEIFKDLIEEV